MLPQTLFLLALVTACVIEVPVLLAMIRLVYKAKEPSTTRIIFTGILCNCLTLPYLWFIFPPYINMAYYPAVGETLVTMVETVILNRVLGLEPKRALVASIVMNAASYVLGLVLL